MNDKKIFATGIGIIALIADAITILQFIDKNNFLHSSYNISGEFWSFSWIISIFFITILYAIGIFFLSYAFGETPTLPVLALGGVYIAFALIIYFRWGYLQIGEELNLKSFLAIAFLFAVSGITGIVSIYMANAEYLRFPSYGFGIANLIILLMLINKYALSSNSLHLGVIGEGLILIIGAVSFLFLFFFDE
ncbi:hypothetical protein [Terasakiella sp. SH-1]|uniref:hypothetical protein n=1 Tax=Terasakiella sp. SH-1 TaxID=2560057 RepID=UPI001073162F|nr:hypothetical protein [Terasakiella sp. SH-1]